ncbi:MAG: hypothetical protein AMXMBFR58_02860 [Phycisphaerae bacterium]
MILGVATRLPSRVAIAGCQFRLLFRTLLGYCNPYFAANRFVTHPGSFGSGNRFWNHASHSGVSRAAVSDDWSP